MITLPLTVLPINVLPLNVFGVTRLPGIVFGTIALPLIPPMITCIVAFANATTGVGDTSKLAVGVVLLTTVMIVLFAN